MIAATISHFDTFFKNSSFSYKWIKHIPNFQYVIGNNIYLMSVYFTEFISSKSDLC